MKDFKSSRDYLGRNEKPIQLHHPRVQGSVVMRSLVGLESIHQTAISRGVLCTDREGCGVFLFVWSVASTEGNSNTMDPPTLSSDFPAPKNIYIWSTIDIEWIWNTHESSVSSVMVTLQQFQSWVLLKSIKIAWPWQVGSGLHSTWSPFHKHWMKVRPRNLNLKKREKASYLTI